MTTAQEHAVRIRAAIQDLNNLVKLAVNEHDLFVKFNIIVNDDGGEEVTTNIFQHM